jgi:translocation and assembly module TamA
LKSQNILSGFRSAGIVAGALLCMAWPHGALSQASPAPAPAPAPAPPPGSDEDWVGQLDPDTPLAPLPDMDVPWPDLDTPLPEAPPLPPEEQAQGAVPPLLPDAAADPQLATSEPALELPPPISADLAVPTEETVIAADAPMAQVSADGQSRYRVELGDFGDLDTGSFATRFDALSTLRAGEDDAANAAQINRRISEDSELLNRILRNLGYYDATLTSDVVADGERLRIRFGALPGPLYRYDAVRLNGLSSVGSEELARLEPFFPLSAGDPVDADRLIGAQITLRSEMLETGYPFANIGDELVTVDHDTRLADLDQPVVPGERLRFGGIIANDNGLLGARHMQRMARFRPGEWYRQSGVEDLRRALIATGLVASADLMPVEGAEAVDLRVDIEPAPPRTLAAAIGYSSGEGFRVEGSWEHRNLFPPEGALIARGVIGTQEQLASLTYRRNNFRRRDHTLTVQALISNVERDAYLAETALISARIERQSTLIYQKRWTWSAGIELVATDELDQRSNPAASRQTYFVGALPTTLGYDRSNDLLDPTSGFRLLVRVSPEISIRGEAFGYVRAQFDGTLYYPVNERVVLAGRARVGTIAGTEVDAIAPSRRYYAGGGSSVRGFGYQRIGPLDAFNDPTGGRSLFEIAAEARIRLAAFGGNFSVVPFIDAGNVYRSQYPDFSGMRVGAGIGVRYHSSFGPIRVDLGTPINPRAGDSRIAVYVSLGQAF